MAAANFAPALALVLSYEGPPSNDPADPGGATCCGVDRETLSSWRGHECSVADVMALTRPVVAPLYKAHVWDAISADQLPSGVDLICFDGATNEGPEAMAHILQRAAGVTVDGQIGPQTIAAIAHVSPIVMVERIRLGRLNAYKADANFRRFGTGWLNRLTSVSHTATSWATRAAA